MSVVVRAFGRRALTACGLGCAAMTLPKPRCWLRWSTLFDVLGCKDHINLSYQQFFVDQIVELIDITDKGIAFSAGGEARERVVFLHKCFVTLISSRFLTS
jgi:hypothetical protein